MSNLKYCGCSPRCLLFSAFLALGQTFSIYIKSDLPFISCTALQPSTLNQSTALIQPATGAKITSFSISLQHVPDNVIGSLALQVIAITCNIERRLDVFLMLECSEKITQTGKKKENSHNNERGGLKRQTQKLDRAHQQVEAATRPVLVEIADKVGESVGQRTDSQQKRNLHKEDNQPLHEADDREDYDQVKVEDVGNAQGYAQENGEDSNPLAVE